MVLSQTSPLANPQPHPDPDPDLTLTPPRQTHMHAHKILSYTLISTSFWEPSLATQLLVSSLSVIYITIPSFHFLFWVL